MHEEQLTHPNSTIVVLSNVNISPVASSTANNVSIVGGNGGNRITADHANQILTIHSPNHSHTSTTQYFFSATTPIVTTSSTANQLHTTNGAPTNNNTILIDDTNTDIIVTNGDNTVTVTSVPNVIMEICGTPTELCEKSLANTTISSYRHNNSNSNNNNNNSILTSGSAASIQLINNNNNNNNTNNNNNNNNTDPYATNQTIEVSLIKDATTFSVIDANGSGSHHHSYYSGESDADEVHHRQSVSSSLPPTGTFNSLFFYFF